MVNHQHNTTQHCCFPSIFIIFGASQPINQSINQSEEEEGEERDSIQELSLTLQKENWTNFDGIWEVVATQLEGWSLPTPDVPVSNAVIGKLFLPLLMLLTVLKRRQ